MNRSKSIAADMALLPVDPDGVEARGAGATALLKDGCVWEFDGVDANWSYREAAETVAEPVAVSPLLGAAVGRGVGAGEDVVVVVVVVGADAAVGVFVVAAGAGADALGCVDWLVASVEVVLN